jgi:hypothetical protein
LSHPHIIGDVVEGSMSIRSLTLHHRTLKVS